jgi:hypothetical protein
MGKYIVEITEITTENILTVCNFKDESDKKSALKKITEHEKNMGKTFLLKWQGGRIPRGAVIEDKEISWTQDRVVSDIQNKKIGSYQRLIQFGGKSRKNQEILVFLDK